MSATATADCHERSVASSSEWWGGGGGGYRNDASTGAHGADVEHEHLVLAQLCHFALLLTPLQAILLQLIEVTLDKRLSPQ